MTRVSQISASKDFEIELRREALRDRRWKRHRNMLFSLMLMLTILGVRFSPLAPTLIRWL
jgi:hypothetical protein